MIKDFLVSSTLDLILILLLFPNTYGPNPGLYKKISCQIAGISQSKVQEMYQSVQIYPCEGPKDQPTTLRPYMVVQFSRSVVSDSATPWIAARQASLSITNSQSSKRHNSYLQILREVKQKGTYISQFGGLGPIVNYFINSVVRITSGNCKILEYIVLWPLDCITYY